MYETLEVSIEYEMPVTYSSKESPGDTSTTYEKLETTIDIEIDIEQYRELEDEEKEDYIKEVTLRQFKSGNSNAKNIVIIILQEDLDDFDKLIDDIYDTSDMHIGESLDEFMEHEDY